MRRRRRLLARMPALMPVLTLAQPAPLKLNSASLAELDSPAGVGAALAERLLAARAVAPFRDWADLRWRWRLRGLGPALLRQLSEQGLRVQGHAHPGPVSAPTQTG
jgi:DNA uptake protein ComE-like DNA-binding protein